MSGTGRQAPLDLRQPAELASIGISTAVGAVVVAVVGHLVFDRFVINRLGNLTWDGTTDVWRLTFLAAGIAAGWVSARLYRIARESIRSGPVRSRSTEEERRDG